MSGKMDDPHGVEWHVPNHLIARLGSKRGHCASDGDSPHPTPLALDDSDSDSGASLSEADNDDETSPASDEGKATSSDIRHLLVPEEGFCIYVDSPYRERYMVESEPSETSDDEDDDPNRRWVLNEIGNRRA